FPPQTNTAARIVCPYYSMSNRSSFPYFFSFYCSVPHRDPPSFPTRRSSDLATPCANFPSFPSPDLGADFGDVELGSSLLQLCMIDRKCTRLNSSHLVISYAVFCLKKKTRSLFP